MPDGRQQRLHTHTADPRRQHGERGLQNDKERAHPSRPPSARRAWACAPGAWRSWRSIHAPADARASSSVISQSGSSVRAMAHNGNRVQRNRQLRRQLVHGLIGVEVNGRGIRTHVPQRAGPREVRRTALRRGCAALCGLSRVRSRMSARGEAAPEPAAEKRILMVLHDDTLRPVYRAPGGKGLLSCDK